MSHYKKIDYVLRTGTSSFADLVERSLEQIDAMAVGGFRAYYWRPLTTSAKQSTAKPATERTAEWPTAKPATEQVAAQRATKAAAKIARRQDRLFAEVSVILQKEGTAEEVVMTERVISLLESHGALGDEVLLERVAEFAVGLVSVNCVCFATADADAVPVTEGATAEAVSADRPGSDPEPLWEGCPGGVPEADATADAEESTAVLQITETTSAGSLSLWNTPSIAPKELLWNTSRTGSLYLQITEAPPLSAEEWPHLPPPSLPSVPLRLCLQCPLSLATESRALLAGSVSQRALQKRDLQKQKQKQKQRSQKKAARKAKPHPFPLCLPPLTFVSPALQISLRSVF